MNRQHLTYHNYSDIKKEICINMGITDYNNWEVSDYKLNLDKLFGKFFFEDPIDFGGMIVDLQLMDKDFYIDWAKDDQMTFSIPFIEASMKVFTDHNIKWVLFDI